MAVAKLPNPRELYSAYKLQERTYADAADSYKASIADALSSVGFELLEARHKGPLELYKKQRRKNYQDPWVDCPDLVGARVVVALSSDKDKAVEAIQRSSFFTGISVEDQTIGADPDKLDYRGLHLHLTAEIENDDRRPIGCELQIRTVAEHSWAVTDHKFVYKNSESLSYEVRRTFRRLLVLVELFDQELSKGVEMVKSDPAYAQMNFVLFLESRFEQLTGFAGDQETTRQFVALLSNSMALRSEDLLALVNEYLDTDQEALMQLIEGHGPDSEGFDVDAGWLTSQPEILLVMSLLKKDEYQLSNALANSDAYQYVEPIAVWSDHAGFVR